MTNNQNPSSDAAVKRTLEDYSVNELSDAIFGKLKLEGFVYSSMWSLYQKLLALEQKQVCGLASSCYRLASVLKTNSDARGYFKEQEFWKSERHNPEDDHIMQAVLLYALDAKTAALRDRAATIAAVLNQLSKEGVSPDDVVSRIRTGGGIDKLYWGLCGKGNADAVASDNLDILKAELPEADGERRDNTKD